MNENTENVINLRNSYIENMENSNIWEFGISKIWRVYIAGIELKNMSIADFMWKWNNCGYRASLKSDANGRASKENFNPNVRQFKKEQKELGFRQDSAVKQPAM